MRGQQKRVYVDSNVFIFPVIYERSHKANKAKEILRGIGNGDLVAYTSSLTWDEVVWIVFKTLGRADSLEVGNKLLKFPNLRLTDVTESVVAGSQKLMEKYNGLSPRDAVHCSSAMTKGIETIISDDQHFDSVKEIRRIPIEKFG